jgi:hypothetical protein
MRRIIPFFFLSLTFVHLYALERIRVEGNRFVDPEGKTVILRGVNSSDPDKLEKAGHWNDEYFQEISEWGANVVRFPIHPKAWRERTPEKYLILVDEGVRLAQKFDLYVIIDWHSIGNLLEEKFQDPSYRTSMKETLEFWETMAKRYRDNPVVAFYELYNEPTISGDQFGTMTWAQWKMAQEQIIERIRKFDKDTIVLVAGFDWAYDLTPIREDPFTAPNLAYVSHPYPQKRDPPWEEKWESDWGFVAEKYPVILTEIGFCLENERGAHIPVISTEEYGKSITEYTEKKGISWVLWVFDPNWSPMLFWDWDFEPTTQGKFFKGYLQRK